MDDSIARKKQALAIVIGVVVFLVIIFVVLLLNSHPVKTTGKAGPPETLFSNIGLLVDDGVSSNQADGLKNALEKYSKTLPSTIKSISVAPGSVAPEHRDRNSSSTSNFINFDVWFDNTLYHARMEYSGESMVRLYLYDHATNKLLYDSGGIDQTAQNSSS